MASNNFIFVQDVANELGLSRPYAYKIVQKLNKEPQAKNILTISGRVNRQYPQLKYPNKSV